MDDDVKDLIESMKNDKDRPRKFWSPESNKEGNFPIRILPRIKDKGEKLFYFHHRVHWINNVAYECLRQDVVYGKDGKVHESEKCPVCDFVQKLYNTSERGTEEWDLAGRLKAQDRYIYRIVVRGTDDETKPVFYEAGKTIQEILFHIIAESDFGNITDLKNGRDFLLDKKGTKRMSNYKTSSPSAKETPVFTDATKIRALIENMRLMDYTPLIEFVTYDQLKTSLTAFINDDNSSVNIESSSTDNELENTPTDAKPTAKVSQMNEAKSDDDIDNMLKDLGFDA